jgi:trimeric autotransporter adhesin
VVSLPNHFKKTKKEMKDIMKFKGVKISATTRDFFIIFICIMLIIALSNICFGQNVGINNPNPNTKALLDLTSTDKGLLTPRMTQAQRVAMFPSADASAKGMLVYQTDGTQGFYYYDGVVWQFLNNGSAGWGVLGNAGTNPSTNFIGTTDNNDMVTKVNNQELMRYTTAKKIAIGTTAPVNTAARIEIADEDGNNSDIALRVAGGGSGGGRGDLSFMKSRGTVASPTIPSAGDAVGTITGSAYDGVKYSAAALVVMAVDSTPALDDIAGSLRFYTYNNNNYTEGMRINSKGNIGINNSTPGFPLNFNGATGDKISLWGNSGAHYGFGIQASLLQIHSASNADDIAFGYGSSSSFSERMRVKGNGKVGIGTSTPGSLYNTAILEIADSTGTNKDVVIRSSNNTNYQQVLAFARTRGTYSTPAIVQNNDNLGRFSGMGYDGTILHTAAEIQYHVDSVPGTNSMPGNMTFHTTPANSSSNCIERMRIDHSGNVGIGVSSPAAKLDIAGSVKIVDGTQGNGKVLTSNASGVASWQTLGASSVSAWGLTGNAGTSASTNYMGTSDNNDVVFKSNNTEAFRIKTSQRVGIGTTSPNQKLDVNGHINISTDSTYRIGNLGVLSSKGTWNTFVGPYAGINNTGQQNAFTGYWAGNANTTGSYNTFNGFTAGYTNTSGSNNTYLGYRAGKTDSTGSENTVVGSEAGAVLSTGSYNTYVGRLSGYNTAASNYNVCVGYRAGYNTTVGFSTFIGTNAGGSNTTGIQNTYVGLNCGASNTTGGYNTMMGYYSGYENTTGGSNTFYGQLTGRSNTTGSWNTFLGTNTGYSNTTGAANVCVGQNAGFAGTSSAYNVLIGYAAGYNNNDSNSVMIGAYAGTSNTSGKNNFFAGCNAGNQNTTGNFNAFSGGWAGAGNTTGTENAFHGYHAGWNNSTGSYNTFMGTWAGLYNGSANYNVFVGNSAGKSCTVGLSTFIGTNAGVNNTTGAHNTFVGLNSGLMNVTGANNTFLGYYSGYNNLGSNNIFIGESSGLANNSGSDNIAIGKSADMGSSNLSNAIAIGNNAVVNTSNSMVLGNNVNVGIGTSSPQTKLHVNGGVAIAPATGISATTSNFAVTVGNNSYLRIGSNDVAANRALVLSDGLQAGQLLMIECTSGGTAGIRIADNAGTNNTNTVSNRDMGSGDVITLLWNGTDWLEQAYSDN